MQNLISFMECVIKFNVSSTIMVLFQFKQKLKKPHYLKNGEFDKKKCKEQKRCKI